MLMLLQVQRLQRTQHAVLVYSVDLELHATIVQPKSKWPPLGVAGCCPLKEPPATESTTRVSGLVIECLYFIESKANSGYVDANAAMPWAQWTGLQMLIRFNILASLLAEP
jgi:hypothetical protein